MTDGEFRNAAENLFKAMQEDGLLDGVEAQDSHQTYKIHVISEWRKTPGRNDMAVAEDYPASWSDVTMQPDSDILAGLDVFVAEGVVTAQQLTAIQNDSGYVVVSVMDDSDPEAPVEPDDLTPTELEALRSEIASVYHDDVAKLATDDTVNPLAIADKLVTANRFPPWRVGEAVDAGDVRSHNRNLYEVVQGHTTQGDWPPDIAVALFKRYYNPDNAPEPWRQPLGAHDAYRIGQRVTHNGSTWESTVDANSWEPGVFGWSLVDGGGGDTDEWQAGVAYATNDEVTYEGTTYRCLQAHTSQVGWEPPNVPALWAAV